MKCVFNLKQHLNFESVFPYALVFVLSFLSTTVNTCHNAMGQVSTEEPHISLNVKNKPLGDVLKIISEDTGYKFKLNNQWAGYPISASLKNMPLHQTLKRILGRLNHTIIYESDKRVNIVIYADTDSRKINQSPIKSFSSQIQKNEQDPAPSPEALPEKADDLERVDESSRETAPSEGTEEMSAETKDSIENAETDSVEKAGVVESKETDKESNSQIEISNEQNEQKKVDEDASPDSSQGQN